MEYKILNLYAGVGGNRSDWDRVAEQAGITIEVTAVELDPKLARLYQERFPMDKVIVADAHQYLLDHYQEFSEGFVWSSPPCPSHSKMMKATRHNVVKYPDFKLYEEVVLLDNFFKGKYCVENVIPYYQPLIAGQKVNRHLYWANFKIPKINLNAMPNFSKAKREQIANWLGFDYPGRNYYIDGCHDPAKPLRNCVHPKEGAAILRTALDIKITNSSKQQNLF